MVEFINDKREMTTLEARKIYKGLYLGFLITKSDPNGLNFDNWTGKVLYTAETYIEHYDIPAENEKGEYIMPIYGMGVKDLPQGGVTVVRNKGK